LGKFKEDLDVEKGAEHLAKFLKSCVEEMRLVAYSLGKTDFAQINRRDLVTVDRDLSFALVIDYAGSPPTRKSQETVIEWTPEITSEENEQPNIHH
jgi:hypothetical protein